MHGICCDGCGEPLLVDSNVRYVVKIEVYAAYDPLEITEEDLGADDLHAWERLIKDVEGADPEELKSEIHMTLRYDLCPVCRREYVRDALYGARFATAPGRDGRPPA